MNELIEKLSTIRAELAREPLTPEQIEALSAQIHEVYEALRGKPWVTMARLDLSAAVMMLSGEGSNGGEPWQVSDAIELIDRAIAILRRLVAKGVA